jgi:hypothetical protein
MKKFSILILLISVLAFSACKDDPTPFEEPENGMYFNGFVNNYEKAIVEGKNGYRYTSTDSCDAFDLGVSLFATSFIFQGNSNYYMSNRECFGLNYYNLWDTVLTNRDSVINRYFNNPMPFAYIDTTATELNPLEYGVEVIWVDGKGDVYTTLHTPQTGTFTFEEYLMSMGANGRSIKVKGSFSCSLYSVKHKKTLQLTQGKARISVNTACF